MKKMLRTLALSLFSIPLVYASEDECLARILYQESRGESLEGAATLGQAAVELALNMQTTLCKLEKSGLVHSKEIPKPLKPAFTALATVSRMHPRLLSKGADHWDTGGRPHMRGKIKRVIGAHTFYQLTSK